MDRQALLRLLSGGDWVSGQLLAQRLGVSRAAVSKTLAALRKEGCELQSRPRQGYRLLSVPSPLSEDGVRALLGEHPWARSVAVLPVVDSTNSFLKRAAAEGAPHGTVVIADCQTGGRGRRGHSFDSAAGAGLYLSVLLRPRCAPGALMSLTAQTAVAARRAIREVCGIAAEIKWVNDLFLNGKKICGILTELTLEAESGLVDCAVIGVGINCTRTQFPEELRQIAGSVLSQAGIAPKRNALAAALIRRLSALPAAGNMEPPSAAPTPELRTVGDMQPPSAAPTSKLRTVGDAFPRQRMRPAIYDSLPDDAGRYPGEPGKTAPTEEAPELRTVGDVEPPSAAAKAEDWLSEYRAACLTLGRRVRVQTPDGERIGTAEDVGEDAELIVRFGSGESFAVNSGEAVILN